MSETLRTEYCKWNRSWHDSALPPYMLVVFFFNKWRKTFQKYLPCIPNCIIVYPYKFLKIIWYSIYFIDIPYPSIVYRFPVFLLFLFKLLHLEAKMCPEARSAQSSNCAEANAALRRATNGLKELDKAHIYMGHQPKMIDIWWLPWWFIVDLLLKMVAVLFLWG